MKNKNNLKYLTLGILLTGAVGFSTLAIKQVQVKAENENVVNINRENKKLVSYDDENQIITFTANELNNYTFINLLNEFKDNFDYWESNVLSNSEIQYNEDIFTFDSISMDNYNGGTFISLTYQKDTTFIYTDYGYDEPNVWHDEYINKFVLWTDIRELFQYDVYWSIDTPLAYQKIKTAIELDIQANESSYGESIITAISSGLGLIPDLAQEFLNGFTTLFWDSAQEKLTDFGTFALVFLGVAITMAVVKLCLAILRSNTGA